MSQTDTTINKKPKIIIFVKLSTDFVIQNVEKVNKEKICCPVCFTDKTNAIFSIEKCLKMTSKKTEVQNISVFLDLFYFRQTVDRLRGLEC